MGTLKKNQQNELKKNEIMKITGLHIGSVDIKEVSATSTTFNNRKATVNQICVHVESNEFSGSLSLDRFQAKRLIKCLQKKLIIKSLR